MVFYVLGKVEVETEDGSGFYNLSECSICRGRFGRHVATRSHILTVHMKKGKKCPTCAWIVFSDQRLLEHIPKCAGNKNRCIRMKRGNKVVKVKVSSNLDPNCYWAFVSGEIWGTWTGSSIFQVWTGHYSRGYWNSRRNEIIINWLIKNGQSQNPHL